MCPEVEVGMGTPRESIRLVDESGVIRLRTVTTGVDHTASMTAYAARRTAALDDEDLCGYVLKRDSPSCGMCFVQLVCDKHCGMTRVKVFGGKEPGRPIGVGIFAQALLARFPHLPVEEDGRLTDPRLRENFIERIFAYRRLRDLFESRWSIGDLVRFHTAHKLVLLAHSTQAYTRLGRLVAGAKAAERAQLRSQYTAGFMDALTTIATPKRHTKVLHHMVGYFKKALDAASRAELLASIEDYRLGLVPLVVPMTLVRHHVRVHDVQYLPGQIYLAPHPKELMLRNHV